MIKVAPSLLAADFSKLGQEVGRVEKAGCDMLHVDVMDGHFVPNITVGPFIVQAIKRVARTPLDVHLMIESPMRYVKDFVKAGSSNVTIHAEACPDNLEAVIDEIRSLGAGCGVSLKPASSLDLITPFLKKIDLVLLMTVNPGFGGQLFMPEVLPKIRTLRSQYSGDIEVDGGINSETAKLVIDAGANVLVAGTFIFGKEDVKKAIEDLRCHK